MADNRLQRSRLRWSSHSYLSSVGSAVDRDVRQCEEETKAYCIRFGWHDSDHSLRPPTLPEDHQKSCAVTPIGRKSVHNRITFDVNESQDNETAEQSPKQTALEVSDKKVIRLKPSSHSSVNSEDTNSANSQELIVKRPERKRIVFDLKDDDNDSWDSGKEGMTFTGIRPMVVTTVVPKCLLVTNGVSLFVIVKHKKY